PLGAARGEGTQRPGSREAAACWPYRSQSCLSRCAGVTTAMSSRRSSTRSLRHSLRCPAPTSLLRRLPAPYGEPPRPPNRRIATPKEKPDMVRTARSATSAKVRKRDTGEQGNKGEFTAVTRSEADIPIPASSTGARPIIGEDAQIAASAQLGDA